MSINRYIFKLYFLEEAERGRTINVWLPLVHTLLGTWSATQESALSGNRTSDPLVCRPVLNPLSHTSQGPLINEFVLHNEVSGDLLHNNVHTTE